LRDDSATVDFRPAGLAIRPGRILSWIDRDVTLTDAEYRILVCLFAANGGVVSYRTVYDSYQHKTDVPSGDNRAFEPLVRSRVKFVRKKLEKIGLAACLKNVAKQGYRWDAAAVIT
jgi:DNA-binding winged helix-turn-helix (wHTH) protein